MRAFLLITALIMLASSNGIAVAEKANATTDAASAHYETGNKFFLDGEFEKARIEFEAAYKLTNEPDLLFNIAICYEREGAVRSALTALETYAAKRPADEKAQAKIKRMREELGIVKPPSTGDPANTPSRRFTPRRIAGIALVSLGAAALIATIGLGASTERDRRALESGTLTFTEATAAADRAAGTRGGAIGLGVVFALSVGAGVPLLVLPQK